MQEQISDILVKEEEKNTAGNTEKVIKAQPSGSDALEHVKQIDTDENTTQKPHANEQASSQQERSQNLGHDPYN